MDTENAQSAAPLEPLVGRALWHGVGCYVPPGVAVCPECGLELTARALGYVAATGRPIAASIEIECLGDMNGLQSHRWYQSEWQPVRDAIVKWCDALKG